MGQRATATKLYRVIAWVYVRLDPDPTAKIVGILKPGTHVEVVAHHYNESAWVRVPEGWACEMYLEKIN